MALDMFDLAQGTLATHPVLLLDIQMRFPQELFQHINSTRMYLQEDLLNCFHWVKATSLFQYLIQTYLQSAMGLIRSSTSPLQFLITTTLQPSKGMDPILTLHIHILMWMFPTWSLYQ